ncbi:hypothetical protein [Nafulsella turpanensis]|uniref:hypothetical protein n=1 Tax=Nafulsella turpanensis TaxID=1265690 RepID=UPI00036E59CF|nr:hypothetical protein [Nafulsella turpanensis]
MIANSPEYDKSHYLTTAVGISLAKSFEPKNACLQGPLKTLWCLIWLGFLPFD